MEQLLSAIASDLFGRALTMLIQRYCRSKVEEREHKLQRLQHLLLRIEITVEEAEGRDIRNQAMLRQLEMLRKSMFVGHYMLDTFRYRGHGNGSIDNISGGSIVALSRFSGFTGRASSSDMGQKKIVLDAKSIGKLEKMLDGLEILLKGDMQEFIQFLEGYPRVPRQPYSTYLILEKVMFGRQMEMEIVINFLLCPEFSGDGTPRVLPIFGAARVGKSTLVEHVCLDERVRSYFSSIVFFAGHDLEAGNMGALKGVGVIKHQDRTAYSHGRSLVVIELDGDMDKETWQRLYASAASFMEHGSKIIVTSRLEKIAAFGTGQALRLKYLTEEAFWYFFKALAFGSANPEDQPKLASIGMDIAVLLNRSILTANVVGSLMRANLNREFWSRLRKCLKDYRSRHLLTYGEDPTDLLRRDHPVYLWSMARTQHSITMFKLFRAASPQNIIPDPELLTSQDIVAGRRVPDHGEFCIVSWRSTIPPYYTYLARCVSQNIRCPTANRKRPRQCYV